MKIFNVTENSRIYTSNSYLVLGKWNTLYDLNTLIDAGCDHDIASRIRDIYTGVGKKELDQIILTHNHSDHSESVNLLKKIFSPKVYAFTFFDGVDELIKDGQHLRVADSDCEIIHIPQHSSDSICIYFNDDRILFAGDTPLIIRSADGTYSETFVKALEKLSNLKIDVIYFGHGKPLTCNISRTIDETLEYVRKSSIISTIV